MNIFKLIKVVTSIMAMVVSVSAFSAPNVLLANKPNLLVANKLQVNTTLQPLRVPVLQAINPVFVNNFALATKDYKTFHGSMCQPYNGDFQGDFNHLDTGLYNEATVSRTVVCPIVRDNINKTNGVWAAIYVNNPANKTFSCWMDSRGKFGNLIKWKNRVTNNPGNQTLSIDVYQMVKDGNFNLYCRVPARGRIASYKIGEILRTDSNN